jgi:hypothetical protein
VVFFVFSFLWMFLMEGMGWALRQEQSLHTGVIGLEHVAMRWMNGDEEVILRGAIFDERRFVFKVVDNPPDSSKSLADRALEVGALAGVNGGFFSKEFEPLGGYVVGGNVIQRARANRLLTGVVGMRGGSLFIERFQRFRFGRDVREMIQSGPFLVEGGESVIGLNTVHRARRTAVASDGRGRWALVSLDNVTLYEAADLLSRHGVGSDFRVDVALNLDGGSSSGFWVVGNTQPFYWGEWVRVRNFLMVVARN